jgi:hypothetical protein
MQTALDKKTGTTVSFTPPHAFKIALITLIAALALITCDNGSTNNGGGNMDPKSISITGITGLTGYVAVGLYSSPTDLVAGGTGTIESNTLTVALKILTAGFEPSEQDWTGSGNYIVTLESGGNEYIYTDGKTLTELGITSDADLDKVPRLGFNSASTSVAFNKFYGAGG